jgi:hypothetical protein
MMRHVFHTTPKCDVNGETSQIHAFAHLDQSGYKEFRDCLE